MADPAQVVIVDTNVYLRLYCSSVRPILGGVFSGRRLMITQELFDEFHNSYQLTHAYHWLATPASKAEMEASVLRLRSTNATRVERKQAEVDVAGRVHLAAYCRAKGIATRTLSICDRRALATACALGYQLCTDEWPLAEVARELGCPHLTSLDILKLMEDSGDLTPDARRGVVQNWILLREELPRGWKDRYEALFLEAAPN